jgi:hypothetical protein
MPILFKNLDLPARGRDVAQVLNDYDHELFLERLPDGHPRLMERPDHLYAVIHRKPGVPEYVVDNYPETMLDERILAQVFEWDTRRFGKDIDKFDALTMASIALQERRRADEIAEGRDKVRFAYDRAHDRGKRLV